MKMVLFCILYDRDLVKKTYIKIYPNQSNSYVSLKHVCYVATKITKITIQNIIHYFKKSVKYNINKIDTSVDAVACMLYLVV